VLHFGLLKLNPAGHIQAVHPRHAPSANAYSLRTFLESYINFTFLSADLLDQLDHFAPPRIPRIKNKPTGQVCSHVLNTHDIEV